MKFIGVMPSAFDVENMDVKFVFFKIQTSCKIPILFELCLGPKSGRGRSP